MTNKTLSKPIRLILGQAAGGQVTDAKITFVFEDSGGRAGYERLDTSTATMLMRFVDDDESSMVWETVEEKKPFGGTQDVMKLKEIRIRRDFQTGLR